MTESAIITSPANERLKHARRVRDGRDPDLIFVEGERLVEECLQAGLPLMAAFHLPEPAERSQAIITEIARRDCPLFQMPEAVMAHLSDTVSPQGIVVLAARPSATIQDALRSSGLIVALDAVQDPGNFGNIVRTAEAAGVGALISLKGSVEAFAPKTLRSAMGSAFRLPLVTEAEPDEALAAARAYGFRVAVTAADGEVDYTVYDWRQPTIVVFGNEARGVRRELLERCDTSLRIHLRPPVESLNVAAAVAAVLFEAVRQTVAATKIGIVSEQERL